MPDSYLVQEENLISEDPVVWLRETKVVSIKSEAGAVINVAQLGVKKSQTAHFFDCQ